MSQKLRFLSAVFFCAVFTNPSFAESRAHDVAIVNQWYSAISPDQPAELMKVNAAALLSLDAQIVLKDLGINQTGPEFLDSLDDWADAIKDGFVAHRIEDAKEGHVTVLVCYDFDESALMTREVFDLVEDQIVKSVQETVAENCDDF